MRLLIIEDDQELQKVLKKGLESQGFSVDVTGSGREGLELLDVNEYDLLLLDLNLPDIDGLEILSQIRNDGKNIPVIILSAHNTLSYRVNGLDLGADDYLVKPFDFIELKSRIHAVIRRAYGRSHPEIKIDKLRLIPGNRSAYFDGEMLELSGKEYDLLEYLASNYPEIVSSESIISHIYDDTFDPFSSVLRVHFLNLRKKISRVTPVIKIETIKGVGYRLWVDKSNI